MSMTYTGIKDIDNIIDEYKWSIEHRDKMKKVLREFHYKVNRTKDAVYATIFYHHEFTLPFEKFFFYLFEPTLIKKLKKIPMSQDDLDDFDIKYGHSIYYPTEHIIYRKLLCAIKNPFYWHSQQYYIREIF